MTEPTKFLQPRKAINKAFLKIKPNRTEIESFKGNLIQLLDRSNDTESEEFHKNLVSDFLKKTYYENSHFINTKGRNDLVIHTGNAAKDSVGVIIEAKKPTNKAEMLSKNNINSKAFQELVLYYLRERITHKNLEIKHLIATNIYEWFIFDAQIFEKLFAQNKALVKHFEDFEAGRLSGKTTDFFYREIAEPFIKDLKLEVDFTFFDFREYDKALRNSDKKDDNQLIALYKLLSPEHLLKLPFANDSNSLDKRFYGELLHLIGLSETKEGGKKLIERNKIGERNSGSLLENAIVQIDSLDKLSRISNPSQFGKTQEERLFNLGLELCITWINRILFLKLLEAQLKTYHKKDKSYEFLNCEKIANYDALNKLFFQVLAKQHGERNEDVKTAFAKVPYLNSSLFEPTEIEHNTLFISNLEDDKTLPIYSASVLKTENGKKKTGNLNAIEYLFQFLDAYDFSSEGSEEIQEDNKTLINASVLGLIFEKINGYKDGSFFTPGFITMYMCKESIRKAVLQKFNETKNWNCDSITSLYNKIDDVKEANKIINSLKICDPAVGSGHFLVSSLNEIIAIKNDLKILSDRNGKRLKEYQFEVVNDELIVTDENGELFEYKPTNKESQRIQETLFHEKQTIIENCLFGVDINPNSVKICRLRLWIELLKNAYYKENTTSITTDCFDPRNELETLPNIDINIKCGNSLISRFDLDSDLKIALKNSKWTIETYKIAVDTYRNAQNKTQKREMEQLIESIKSDFRSTISINDPKIKQLNKLKGEILTLTNMPQLFEKTKTEKATWNKKLQKLTEDSKKLETEISEIKNNKIYENAFEWRFEFPEVLDDDGNFVGFDVVIGNPPYGVNFTENDKKYLTNFDNDVPDFEIYIYFTSLAKKILSQNSHISYIFPNTFLSTKFGKKYRDRLFNEAQVYQIIDLSNDNTFEDASVRTCIFSFRKSAEIYQSDFIGIENKNFYLKNSFTKEFLLKKTENLLSLFYQNKNEILIIEKLRKNKELKEFFEVSQGYIPYRRSDLIKNFGLIEGNKIIDERLWHSKTKLNENWKGEILGKNITRYYYEVNNSYIYYGKHVASFVNDKFFKSPRILIREITTSNLFCTYLKEELYNNPSLINVINEKNILDLKYCLALLNSNLIGWLHNKVSPKANKGLFPKILINDVRIIPLVEVDKDSQEIFIIKVDEILNLKSQNPSADTSVLEAEIDQLVYQLYELTEEEIAIVESAV